MNTPTITLLRNSSADLVLKGVFLRTRPKPETLHHTARCITKNLTQRGVVPEVIVSMNGTDDAHGVFFHYVKESFDGIPGREQNCRVVHSCAHEHGHNVKQMFTRAEIDDMRHKKTMLVVDYLGEDLVPVKVVLDSICRAEANMVPFVVAKANACGVSALVATSEVLRFEIASALRIEYAPQLGALNDLVST